MRRAFPIGHAVIFLVILSGSALARDGTIERVHLDSGFEIVIGQKQIEPGTRLLDALAIWVGAKLGQPVPDTLPRVAFAPVDRMAALRYKQSASELIQQQDPLNIVSIYDSNEQVIYLPDSWSGATAADLSVLVHELVHHFQEVYQTSFECDAQREAKAFELQETWLRIFGTSLEEAFQVDPFTLLARTSCGM